MCRRLIMGTRYYKALKRDDVELVTDDIERMSLPACAPPMAVCTSSTCSCWQPASTRTPTCGRSS